MLDDTIQVGDVIRLPAFPEHDYIVTGIDGRVAMVEVICDDDCKLKGTYYCRLGYHTTLIDFREADFVCDEFTRWVKEVRDDRA